MMWYKWLREFLVSLDLKESYTNPLLFILKCNGETVFLFTYVDDIVVTSSQEALVEEVINAMGKEFALRVLGDLSFFLGIQVKKTSKGLHLSQQQCLVNLLKSCKLDNLRPSTTPMLAQQDLFSEEENEKFVSSEYIWGLSTPSNIYVWPNQTFNFLRTNCHGIWVALNFYIE